MTYKVILIDGNSWGYANHHGTKLHCHGQEVQAIFGFVRALRELKARYPGATVRVLWDGRARHRFALLPEYKSNRGDSPEKLKIKEAYESQKPPLHRMLGHLGVEQLHYANMEADDIAGYLTRRLRDRSDIKVLLTTGDQDWLQLIAPNIHWHDSRKDLTITVDNLFDHTGYKTPRAFLEGKCLTGDTSDCIKGVGGIGEKGAPEFLAEFGSVGAFWKQVDTGVFAPLKKAHIGLASPTGRELFLRNLNLMQLLRVSELDPNERITYPTAFDRDAFLTECENLNFLSITGKIDAFLAPFAPKE